MQEVVARDLIWRASKNVCYAPVVLAATLWASLTMQNYASFWMESSIRLYSCGIASLVIDFLELARLLDNVRKSSIFIPAGENHAC